MIYTYAKKLENISVYMLKLLDHDLKRFWSNFHPGTWQQNKAKATTKKVVSLATGDNQHSCQTDNVILQCNFDNPFLMNWVSHILKTFFFKL